MEKPISSIALKADLTRELQQRGFQTLSDLRGLTALHAVSIPGMNGHYWQLICEALGRKPFPEVASRKAANPVTAASSHQR